MAELFPESRACRALDDLAGRIIDECEEARGADDNFFWRGMLNL